jgi:hypothetical protein
MLIDVHLTQTPSRSQTCVTERDLMSLFLPSGLPQTIDPADDDPKP